MGLKATGQISKGRFCFGLGKGTGAVKVRHNLGGGFGPNTPHLVGALFCSSVSPSFFAGAWQPQNLNQS